MLSCGVFGAAEYSLVTVDRATVERAADSGDKRAQGTLAALRTLSTQLSGAQLGITITNLAIGFLAEPAIGKLLHDPLQVARTDRRSAEGRRVRHCVGAEHDRHDAGRRTGAEEASLSRFRCRSPDERSLPSGPSPSRWPGPSDC